MTHDDRLRGRLEALERSVPRATPPRIAAAGAPRRAARWLPMAAMLTLGIVIGTFGSQAFFSLREPGASSSPEPTGTPSASETPVASSTPSPSPLAIVPVAGLAAGDELLAITQVDGRLIGVGRRGDQGAVWTSPDGGSWALAPDLPAPAKQGNPYVDGDRMRSVVAGPAGLVAIGSWGAIDITTPRVWYSADGQRWSSVYGPSDASLGAFAEMHAVAAGGPGYIAVGYVADSGFTPRPQVWSSADGQAWTAVESGTLTGSLNDVIGGGGMLVAVGGSEAVALAFVSTDGATWTAAPEQTALHGAEMTSVTFGNGTFVATGLVSSSSEGVAATPAIWRSPDGLHWTLVLRGEPGQLIRQAVSTDAGFVAIGGQFPSAGWSYDPAAPNPPRDTIQLWSSADGETWSGPTTGFLADGGITLGHATVLGGDLLVPVTLLHAGPDGPVSQPMILRGPLRTTS